MSEQNRTILFIAAWIIAWTLFLLNYVWWAAFILLNLIMWAVLELMFMFLEVNRTYKELLTKGKDTK